MGGKRPALQGNLDEFQAWAAGDLRDGPRAGVHYAVLEAIERYQMFLVARREREQSELMRRQGSEQ